MLYDFIPDKSYAIVAGYSDGEILAALGGVIYHDRFIEIFFPKVNPFVPGQEITFHLDNRTGLEEFDINLKVYRVSVKATVLKTMGNRIYAEPVEYELKYSNRIVDSYRKPGYAFPEDTRKPVTLREANIPENIVFNEKEKDNKLGVLITQAINRPHTTVMAFLSSINDDIFIISHDDSFKSQNINKNENCVFAIDHRGTFNFEKAIDWNYTLIKGAFRRISKTNPMFRFVQSKFVEKNPWEYAFFTDSKVEMYQIEAHEIMCPEKLARG
jgi:hypothetical protein